MMKKILTWINGVLPKRNVIIFNSNPDLADNAYALYSYIIKNRIDIQKKYKIIWTVNTKEQNNRTNRTTCKTVYKKSLQGLYYFFVSKFIFCTHNYFYDVKSGRDQIIVNLWHGNGYKCLHNEEECYRGDVTFVTSDAYVQIQAHELNINSDNVLVTGLARNDCFFKSKVGELKKLGIDKEKYKSILIWMPTFRKAVLKSFGEDGNRSGFGFWDVVSTQSEKFNSALKKNGILLIVKPHPMEDLTRLEYNCFSNIRIISNRDLEKLNCDLYELLKETDGLISDYSSVVIDYLLLDKPVSMVCSDIEEYKSSRGFVFNRISDYFPGPILKNADDFLNYICNKNKIDLEWLDKRVQLKKFFHKYSDGNSCERIVHCLFDNDKLYSSKNVL